MKIFWKKYKITIEVVCFAAIFGLMAYFLIFPFLSSVELLSDQIQEKVIDQQENQFRISKLPKMKEDWTYFESNQDSINVILNPANQLEFIENIEAIANKTENAISLQIEERPDSKEIERMKKESTKNKDGSLSILGNISSSNYFPVQIKLRGDYNKLVNFINMLENSRIYINITSLEVKKVVVENVENEQDKNIFSSDSEKKEEDLDKKEILDSIIKAVVYIKN